MRLRLRQSPASVCLSFSWAGEKRTALDAWAGLVTSIIEGRLAGNNVLTLAKMG
jgi:hypothetical protein